MKKTAALGLLLIVSGFTFAAPPDVPAPIKLAVNEDGQATVKVAAGKEVAYRAAFGEKDCLLFRGYAPDPSELNFLIRPKRSGDFRVVFWTVGEAASSVLVIQAGDAPPPGPVPPVPPGPTPPVPPPGPDPFAPVLKAAYETDTTPDKGNAKALLLELLKAAATDVGKADSTDKTVADVYSRLRRASNAVMEDKIPKTRAAINQELQKTFPDQPEQVMDATLRKKVADTLSRIATALESF